MRGRLLVAATLAGCGNGEFIVLPANDLPNALATLLSVEHANGDMDLVAYDGKPEALRFTIADRTANIRVALYGRSLSSMGLRPGQVELVSGTEGRALSSTDQVFVARVQGGRLVRDLKRGEFGRLAEVRVAGEAPRSSCPFFDVEVLDTGDHQLGRFVQALIPLEDGSALGVETNRVLKFVPGADPEWAPNEPTTPSSLISIAPQLVDGKAIVGARDGRILHLDLDDLRFETVFMDPETNDVGWLAVSEVGPDGPRLFGLTNTGAFVRLSPEGWIELATLDVHGRAISRGGLARVGPDDLVAVTGGDRRALRYQAGVVRHEFLGGGVVDMATVARVDGLDAVVAANSVGQFFLLKGGVWTPLGNAGELEIGTVASFRDGFIHATRTGFVRVFDSASGDFCPQNQLLNEVDGIWDLAELSDGTVIVGGRRFQQEPVISDIWLRLTAR